MENSILFRCGLSHYAALILLVLGLAFAGACGTEHREFEGDGTGGGEAISAPVPRSPANGAIVDTLSPIIDWDDVPGAVLFQLQVSVSQEFFTSVIDRQVPASSYMISDFAQRPATLFWRVRAQNGSGLWSNWSVTFSFSFDASVPARQDAQSLYYSTLHPDPSAAGEASARAAAYHGTARDTGRTMPAAGIVQPVSGTTVFLNGYVHFAGAAAGQGPLELAWDFGNGQGMEGSRNPPPVLYAEPGVYSARFTVADRNDRESADEIIISVADNAPLPSGPPDGYVSQSDMVEFTWNGLDHAGSYTLSIGKQGTWASYPVDGTSYSIRILAPGRYLWSIQGIDSQGNASRSSDIRSFTIEPGE